MCTYIYMHVCVYIQINLFYFVGKALSHSICVFRCPTMETPLDVLSRAASFVHANEEEGKCHSSHRHVFWLPRCTSALLMNSCAIFLFSYFFLASGAIRRGSCFCGIRTIEVFVKYKLKAIRYASGTSGQTSSTAICFSL